MKPSNSTPTMRCRQLLVALLLISVAQQVAAAELSGRFSMLGATAQAGEGDLGYQSVVGNILSADQQGMRLMLEQLNADSEWVTHLRTVRLHSHGLVVAGGHSSELFRYAELGGTLFDEGDGTTSTVVCYELDRLYYRHQFKDTTLSVGRQAIDWGSGRLWQPLNVFGSFAPTDLDTDYKPGIDTVLLDYFPSSFSSLSAVYAAAPMEQSVIKDSGALYYRRQVGELSEYSLLAGSISGNAVFGGSFESAWGGMGWRVEGVHYQLRELNEESLFWIAGVDYALSDGTMLSAEYYDNSRGASSEEALVGIYSDELVASGLQQQLSRQLFGVGVSRDLTPLLHGGYTLLGSLLKDSGGDGAWSLLHQFNLTYSVSNESDLLVSLLLPTGKGLSSTNEPRSEFGHIPASLTLRLRFYF